MKKKLDLTVQKIETPKGVAYIGFVVPTTEHQKKYGIVNLHIGKVNTIIKLNSRS